MRVIRLLIALICLAAGAILGALNRQLVSIDLGIGFIPATSLGIALIVALLIGALIGGLAISASVVLPLRRRLARAERAERSAAAAQPTLTGPEV
ncbi:lipopolysaccharide assembly protein LapA domain-containing protein [Lysobacter sp. CA199]|uniref:lipopolysaccharide assembly protein LapA domain-containing protein n=1 Tax=Lysobacter sp. CA199 TaxID=3455608 RepID=UPI003F8CF49B